MATRRGTLGDVRERCKPVPQGRRPVHRSSSRGPILDSFRHDDRSTNTARQGRRTADLGSDRPRNDHAPGQPAARSEGDRHRAFHDAAAGRGCSVTAAGFASTGSTSVDDQTIAVPPGTYFILGLVDIDVSGGILPTPGDYAGWYGWRWASGNPPAARETPLFPTPAPSASTSTWSSADERRRGQQPAAGREVAPDSASAA